MMKDVWHFRAFGKIQHMLEREGHTVFTSDHDGMGKIETNAEQLKEYVRGVMERCGTDKVNIIAHSKGGLDTLYMIDRLGMSGHVSSVTFLCTPHKGSIIATRLYHLWRPLRATIVALMNFWYRLFGDKHPDALGVCRELMATPDSVVECFDHHDGVFMQSYSTKLERSRDDFVMGIPLMFHRRYEDGPTDGLVSVESSKFRNYKGHATEGSVSHSEIVDFMVRRSKKEKIYTFYRNLCRDLEQRGD
jgi:triacylglycerol lipase